MTRKLDRLSRAHVLLQIVADATQHRGNDTANELTRYFVPGTQAYYPAVMKGGTTVSGTSDASALRGLERAGFIRRPRGTSLGRYTYAITEDGRVELERLADLARAGEP